MNSSNVALSIISVAYRSNTAIERCLRSIEKYNDIGEAVEVVVVDNCPVGADAFSNIASRFPRVRAIPNTRNGGFGQGNNVGARHAKGKYLLFLNPDTELIEPIFGFALAQFERDPTLALFGMTLCDERGRPSSSFGVIPGRGAMIPAFIWMALLRYLKVRSDHIFPRGADLFVRREVLEKCHGFDENFFLCYEEPDLLRRLPKGSSVRIFDKKIIHIGGHALKREGPERETAWYLESEQYYFQKYGLDYRRFARLALFKLRALGFLRRIIGGALRLDQQLRIEHYRKLLGKDNA